MQLKAQKIVPLKHEKDKKLTCFVQSTRQQAQPLALQNCMGTEATDLHRTKVEK